jgi:hypothetical protein
MGQQAQAAARQYDLPAFQKHWLELLAKVDKLQSG